jgi:hypothetical protein
MGAMHTAAKAAELTNSVCDIADVSREKAAGALLVHLGPGGHSIHGYQHHPPATRGTNTNTTTTNNNSSKQHQSIPTTATMAARLTTAAAAAAGQPLNRQPGLCSIHLGSSWCLDVLGM